ncbi:MAG: hypothetical protein H0T47_22840 [Planctomycetaceae bacterium]|nr:hypothetical protein [Planctomycetaceae bacterium]
MARLILFVASLLLMSVGSSICVAACTKGCVELTGSGHAVWKCVPSCDHFPICRRYAEVQALTNTKAEPITGGTQSNCKIAKKMQYRQGCETCDLQCAFALVATESEIVKAAASDCDNEHTFEDNRYVCKQPKSPEPHCENGVFPPDHDV